MPARPSQQQEQLAQMIEGLRAESAQKRIGEFADKTALMCYDRCVQQPERSLSADEGNCVRNCTLKMVGMRRIVAIRFEEIMRKNEKERS